MSSNRKHSTLQKWLRACSVIPVNAPPFDINGIKNTRARLAGYLIPILFGVVATYASPPVTADDAVSRIELSQRNVDVNPKLAESIWRAVAKKEFGDLATAKDMDLTARGMSIGQVDLNDDGRLDAMVVLDEAYSCGSDGCIVHAVINIGSTLAVYSTCDNAHVAEGLVVSNKKSNGMRNLRAGNVELIFDGVHYCNQQKGK